MKIIMLGVPGADKSTQTKRIAAKYQIPHISTEDISRASIKNGTGLGMKARSCMDAGGLVLDKITIGTLLNHIHEEDYKDGYVLDGFPRTILQAESLTRALGDVGETIDYTINMDVPDKNIINRMSRRRVCFSCEATCHTIYDPPKKEEICGVCGQQLVLRDGDRPETVRERLDVYHNQIQPLVEYYEKADVLVEVDDMLNMEEVFQAIIKILGA